MIRNTGSLVILVLALLLLPAISMADAGPPGQDQIVAAALSSYDANLAEKLSFSEFNQNFNADNANFILINAVPSESPEVDMLRHRSSTPLVESSAELAKAELKRSPS
jgi:hypothetical protein